MPDQQNTSTKDDRGNLDNGEAALRLIVRSRGAASMSPAHAAAVLAELARLRELAGSPEAGQPADDSGAAATARALARHLASISEVLGLPEDAEAADATSRVRALVTGKAAAPSDGWASLPTPEDVAAEMSRQMTGSDTAARRESLVTTACRALDAISTLREKGKGR